MTRVVDNPGQERFEIYLDEKLAGFAAYELEPGQITFIHTEVDPVYEGRGLGGQLASAALDAARARGLRVVPVCPFIRRYIQHHPQYEDLVGSA